MFWKQLKAIRFVTARSNVALLAMKQSASRIHDTYLTTHSTTIGLPLRTNLGQLERFVNKAMIGTYMSHKPLTDFVIVNKTVGRFLQRLFKFYLNAPKSTATSYTLTNLEDFLRSSHYCMKLMISEC